MFDKLIRYSEVKHFIESSPQGSILEVGPGPLGLGCCLPYRFVGVDPWYPEKPIVHQQAVRGSGLALPFQNESFDYVLCIEVLEHLPEAWRGEMVAEMCRVARRHVIITHPHGRLARLGDRFLGVCYDILKIFGKGRPWWLVEHLQNSYPNPDDYLRGLALPFRRALRGRENVFLHVVLVFFGHLRIIARRLDRLYERNPKLLDRWINRVHFPPYSRVEVVLSRNQDH